MGEAVSFVLNGAKVRWTGPTEAGFSMCSGTIRTHRTKCGCTEGKAAPAPF